MLFRSLVCAAFFSISAFSLHAGTLSGSYFSLAGSDPDVGNNQGIGSLVTTVGAGLGPDGLPVVNTASGPGAQLHDVNSATHELEWWAPSQDSNVSVLNNPVYPSQISLPFIDNNMYTNTTVLGQNGDDSSSFLTAEFVGQFTLPSSGNISFNVCSDDDEYVYVSGGAFGSGTLVVDNGGIHGVTCTSGNENVPMLSGVAAGTYTLSVFYADREQSGAAFQLSSSLDLTPPGNTPEPSSVCLAGLGLAVGFYLLRRRSFAHRA